MRTTCVNPAEIPRVDAFEDTLPQPFLAIDVPSKLQKNLTRSLTHLKIGSMRPWVMFDETVWSSSYELVRGVGPEHTDRTVGGFWARQHDENWSLLDPSKLKHQSELPMQKLAKLSLFVVLKRVDSNRWAMDMCLVPREAGISSAQLASCHSRSREHTTEQYQVLGCS